MAVERFKCCENIEWLAKELSVPRQTLYRWYGESERNAEDGEPIPEKSRESRLRREARELKRLIAKQAVELDFFKGALQKIEAGRRGSCGSGELASTPTSGT
jgi:transposase